MISNLDDITLNRQAKYYKPQSAIKGAKLLNFHEKTMGPTIRCFEVANYGGNFHQSDRPFGDPGEAFEVCFVVIISELSLLFLRCAYNYAIYSTNDLKLVFTIHPFGIIKSTIA